MCDFFFNCYESGVWYCLNASCIIAKEDGSHAKMLRVGPEHTLGSSQPPVTAAAGVRLPLLAFVGSVLMHVYRTQACTHTRYKRRFEIFSKNIQGSSHSKESSDTQHVWGQGWETKPYTFVHSSTVVPHTHRRMS